MDQIQFEEGDDDDEFVAVTTVKPDEADLQKATIDGAAVATSNISTALESPHSKAGSSSQTTFTGVPHNDS